MNNNLTEAFFSKKTSLRDKVMSKHNVTDYSPLDKKDEMLGLGSFDELDTREINNRLLKSFGTSLSNNSIKARNRSAIRSFPVIVSDAIDPALVETMKTVYENQYADYIRLFIENQIVDLGDYAGDSDDTIAIQIVNNLIDTEKRQSLLSKLSEKGKLSMSDLLGPAGKLLGFNESMKTGNSFIDDLLESAMICDSKDSALIENVIMLLNNDENQNVLTEAEDLTAVQKSIITDAQTQQYLKHTLNDEFNDNPELKADFKIAITLLGGRKISGSEFLAYCYYLNIPVPVEVRTNILLKFPMGNVLNPLNPNLTIGVGQFSAKGKKFNVDPNADDYSKNTIDTLENEKLIDSLIFGEKNIKAMYLNKKVVMGNINEILSVSIKDFLYSYLQKQATKKRINMSIISGLSLGTLGMLLASPAVLSALALGGFGAGVYALVDYIKSNQKDNKTDKKINSIENGFIDDIKKVLEVNPLAKASNSSYGSKTLTKHFSNIKNAYANYLKDLKKENSAKYDAVKNEYGNSIPLKVNGDNIILSTTTDKFSFNKGFRLEDMDEPASRVITLIQLYKAQKSVGVKPNIEEYQEEFKKNFSNIFDSKSMDNKLFNNINSQLDMFTKNAENDIVNGFNDYFAKVQPSFNAADKDYSEEVDKLGNRQKLTVKHESVEQAETSDYKVIDIPDYVTDGIIEDVPEDVLEEALKSGDDNVSFLLEFITVAEKKAQQEEINKILSAVPMKKFEYDEIRGKTMIAPAFASGGEKVYGTVEYDYREQEKRKFGAPLMLKISFKRRYSDEKMADNELTAYIGIKGEVITIPSEEMQHVLKTNAEGGVLNKVFNFNQDFENIGNVFKNFKLNKDADKLPVSMSVWKDLSKFAFNNAANILAGKKYGNIANAHFLISDREVSELRNSENIDYYRDIKLAKSFMNKYGASTMAIVNETTERMNVIDSPDNISWTVTPLSVIRGANTTDSMVSAISALRGRSI